MKFIRPYNALNENVDENFLEEFISSFTDLVDDGYKLEFRNPYGVNSVYQDYLEKNQNWQKFSSSISSANIKQVGVYINTLNSDYDGFCKLVDDMRPVILSLDDIGWNFIRFDNSIRDLEFRGNLYTFQNDAKSLRPKSISDKEIKDFINNKGFSVDEIDRSEDPDWDGEVVEVQFGSVAYDGLIPSNIDDIVHGISTSLGFQDYIIQRKTNYTVLVQFYL
jgi:hypothetical protein